VTEVIWLSSVPLDNRILLQITPGIVYKLLIVFYALFITIDVIQPEILRTLLYNPKMYTIIY